MIGMGAPSLRIGAPVLSFQHVRDQVGGGVVGGHDAGLLADGGRRQRLSRTLAASW